MLLLTTSFWGRVLPLLCPSCPAAPHAALPNRRFHLETAVFCYPELRPDHNHSRLVLSQWSTCFTKEIRSSGVTLHPTPAVLFPSTASPSPRGRAAPPDQDQFLPAPSRITHSLSLSPPYPQFLGTHVILILRKKNRARVLPDLASFPFWSHPASLLFPKPLERWIFAKH